MSNAFLRVLTALVSVPFFLGVAYLGTWYFGLLMLAIALAAQRELYRMMEEGGLRPHKRAGFFMGALIALHPLLPALVPLAVAFLLVYLAITTLADFERRPLPNISGTVFGIIYPCLLFAFLTRLRVARGPAVDDLSAFFLTLSVLVLIWVTDTAAYYVGRSIGRHALAPRISPNKTWEGALGGAGGALLAAALLKLTLLGFLPWLHVLALALICGCLGQLGDLTESRFKRSVGVKDSGSFLPGHGGMLDRFDALLLAVPLAYLYLDYVAGIFD